MKKSILNTSKPYRNPKWLQGQDKVDDLGPILGSSPKKSKVLSKKFQGCSVDLSDRNVISEFKDENFRPHNQEWRDNEFRIAYAVFNDKAYPMKDRKLAYRRIEFLKDQAKKAEENSNKIPASELKKLLHLGKQGVSKFGAGMVTSNNKVYIAAWHSDIRETVNNYALTDKRHSAIRIRYGGWDCGRNTIIEFGKYDEDNISRVKQVIDICTSPTDQFRLESSGCGPNDNYLDIVGDKEKILFMLDEWATPRVKIAPNSVMAFHSMYDEGKKTAKKLLEKFNNSEVKKAGIISYYRDNKGQVRMMFVVPSDPAYGGDKWQIAKGHTDGNENTEESAKREGREETGLKDNNIKSGTFKLGWKGMITGYTETSEMFVYICEVIDPIDFNKPDYEISKTKWLTPEEFASIGRNSQKHIVARCYSVIRGFDKSIGKDSDVSEINENRKFTVCTDGGSYGPKAGYSYISVKDENGHSMAFIGRAGVAEMNEKQAVVALKKNYPDCEVEVLPNKLETSIMWESKECEHKWKPYGDFDLGGNRTEVKCVYCGVLGERDDETGEVYYPVS